MFELFEKGWVWDEAHTVPAAAARKPADDRGKMRGAAAVDHFRTAALRQRHALALQGQRLRAFDDGNGQIAGRQLDGLALWHDRNVNGRSEPGEVQPVADWDIVALSCAYEHDATHADVIAYSPRGVTLRDGVVRPTLDLVRYAPDAAP